jgi:hypothetical protein
MIRNVVLGRLRAASDAASTAQDRDQVSSAMTGILGLDLPGLVANHAGWDAGLRDGGWDFAITNDWQDAASYREYDVDPEHIRYRQLIGAVCEQLARVQFEITETP